MPPSAQHQETLHRAIEELRREGWKVVDLHGHAPDAVAIKDGKLVAIEALGKLKNKKPGKGWKLMGGFTFRMKRQLYEDFDDVFFFTFYKGKNEGGGEFHR